MVVARPTALEPQQHFWSQSEPYSSHSDNFGVKVSQPKCKEQFESANKTNDTKEEVESKTTENRKCCVSPILQTHPKEDNEKDKDEVERNAKMEMSGDMHIEHLSNIYRTSVEHLSNPTHIT